MYLIVSNDWGCVAIVKPHESIQEWWVEQHTVYYEKPITNRFYFCPLSCVTFRSLSGGQ
jgi:hypothetical protein